MRTTINLPDTVLRDAKLRAAEEGVTLTQLVTEALRQRLTGGRASEGVPFRMRTFAGNGPLPGVDLDDNAVLRAFMDEADDEA
jgi:hypothetical protein